MPDTFVQTDHVIKNCRLQTGRAIRFTRRLEAADEKTIMIDATYLKAHRTASSLRVKKGGVAG